MKSVLFFVLSLLIIFSSVGCTENAAEPSSPPLNVEQESTEVLEKSADTEVFISPLAKELLMPTEDYSWEREHDAEYIVLHFTSAVVPSRNDPYNLERVREIFLENYLSIHYIIDRDGKIYCYIPENRAAWHAGKGEYAGDARLTNAMNKYSIGIELLAIGSKSDMAQYLTPYEYDALPAELCGFTDEQYSALSSLLSDICERRSIPYDREHIIGHSDYNPSKTDPGELFGWDRLFGK